MDVRCDRCQTEYELDDAIVTETGASVQCTTCGHTFFVRRTGSTPPSLMSSSGSLGPSVSYEESTPEVPEWALSTEDGKIHRFRDLNTLQKWIVERKVTRADRVSRSNGPWSALGEIADLAAFFAVVEEADRARASASRPATPAPTRAPSGPMPGVTAPSLGPQLSPPLGGGARRVAEDGPTVPDRRLPATPSAGSVTVPPVGRSANDTGAPAGSRAPDPRSSLSLGIPARPMIGPGSAPAPAAAPTGSSGPAVRPAPGSSPGSPQTSLSGETSRPAARTEIVFPTSTLGDAGDSDQEFLRPSHRGRNVVLALLAVAGASAGFWLWMEQNHPSNHPSAHPLTEAVTPPTQPTGTVSPPLVSPKTPSVQAGLSAPASSPIALRDASTASATPGDASRPMPEAARAPVPEPVRLAAAGGAPGSPGAKPGKFSAPLKTAATAENARGVAGKKDKGEPAKAPEVKGSGYEKLVAEADRLLERGGAAKAEKLYTQALTLRPDGVAALTGSAYVFLDRQKHFKAIEVFRRALAIDPTYGPALFGIGESYRARGDHALALGAYRQYLALSPSGVDASAARRQIKDLEALVGHSAHSQSASDSDE